MFAMTLERNAPEHDHLVVTVDFLERLSQDLLGILSVTREVLLERAGDARGCFA